MRSPYSGSQTIIQNYSEWTLELGFAPQPVDAAKAHLAWRDSLKGSIGSFYYQPRGSGKQITGKTLSLAAYAHGETISVGGWAANAQTGLVAGDYLSLGDKLFRITIAPTVASAAGVAVLEIAPMLRKDFPAGTTVNFVNPRATMRIVDDQETGSGYSRDPDKVSIPSFIAREKL